MKEKDDSFAFFAAIPSAYDPLAEFSTDDLKLLLQQVKDACAQLKGNIVREIAFTQFCVLIILSSSLLLTTLMS